MRGICCCLPRPGQENLRIVSVVDRYLEHSRIFCFHNLGEEEFYLSSADWMTRNLDHRIEAFFPVTEPHLRDILRSLLKFPLEDTDKARRLQPTGVYTRPAPAKYSEARSQWRTYRMFKELLPAAPPPRGILRIFRSGKPGSGDFV